MGQLTLEKEFEQIYGTGDQKIKALISGSCELALIRMVPVSSISKEDIMNYMIAKERMS